MITYKYFINRYRITLLCSLFFILVTVSYPAVIQLQKESREDQAMETLENIRVAQLQYRDDAARGAGYFAADLKALGFECGPDGSFSGPEPARYRFSCNDVVSRAEAQNPESVFKSVLILRHE